MSFSKAFLLLTTLFIQFGNNTNIMAQQLSKVEKNIIKSVEKRK